MLSTKKNNITRDTDLKIVVKNGVGFIYFVSLIHFILQKRSVSLRRPLGDSRYFNSDKRQRRIPDAKGYKSSTPSGEDCLDEKTHLVQGT